MNMLINIFQYGINNKHITIWISNGSPLGEKSHINKANKIIKKLFPF